MPTQSKLLMTYRQRVSISSRWGTHSPATPTSGSRARRSTSLCRLPGICRVGDGSLEATQAGQRTIEHFGSAGFRNVLIACSSAEAELISEVRDALSSALAGGPSPDEKLYRSGFLTRLVQTYDRRKAAALFSAFKGNGTWQVP